MFIIIHMMFFKIKTKKVYWAQKEIIKKIYKTVFKIKNCKNYQMMKKKKIETQKI